MVLTIPERLRIFFRYDRLSPGQLASCAWRALKLYFDSYFDGAGGTPAAVGFLQTSGDLLNFHPHVHVLVTGGGYLPDGTVLMPHSDVDCLGLLKFPVCRIPMSQNR